MKRFMLLHFGFENPTPEIMGRWGAWFREAASITAESGGLRAGREISNAGVKDLPMNRDAITGYTIINAESLEEAEALAARNPFISSIRIYEIAQHG